MRALDRSGDGHVGFEEFLQWWEIGLSVKALLDKTVGARVRGEVERASQVVHDEAEAAAESPGDSIAAGAAASAASTSADNGAGVGGGAGPSALPAVPGGGGPRLGGWASSDDNWPRVRRASVPTGGASWAAAASAATPSRVA